MGSEELKEQISKKVESHRQELGELSLKIHTNPELCYKEVKAAGWLTEYLEENGFSVERGICEIPTAFKASYGQGKPVIAMLAEYDALANLGHACGHNLIAACAAGTGVASKPVVDHYGGTILVIGTPAEEGGGGKVIMAAKGAFDDLDVAMKMHPDVRDSFATRSLACHGLEVEFHGKEAHVGTGPHLGINALEAMIQSFIAINSLRQHLRDKALVNGIITDGGISPTIIPAHSSAIFSLRAEDDASLDKLKEQVINCFNGAATATGARLEYQWRGPQYAAMRGNTAIAEVFSQNMKILGREMQLVNPFFHFSTDSGNVSRITPTITAFIAIASENVAIHSPQFADAAASEVGISSLIDSTRAFTMTVFDLLADPKLVTQAKDEFIQNK
jgi:amidohydrolase